jgi:hypothetical protein
MPKRKLTEEQEKEIKLLQASNEMLERTKEEAKMKGNESSVKRIEIAQQDVLAQMKKIDEGVVNEIITKKEESLFDSYQINNDDIDESVFDIIERNRKNQSAEIIAKEPTQTFIEDSISFDKLTTVENAYNDVNMDLQYDVIPLPSHGEGYKHKIDRVPVAYLTAYDENFITSPNLYEDGLIIDLLLKNKIMNKNINVNELYKGDVDAIVLWLRATSYGPEFPVSVIDPKTGEEIETIIDLSSIKTKEFNLKGDENGHFSFELPVSKDIVKFKFLTRKEEKNLELLTNLENNSIRASVIRNCSSRLNNVLKVDSSLVSKEKAEVNKVLTFINEWAKKAERDKSVPYNKIITNRMELSIMAINDNYDREYIRKYIKTMVARDSLMLRRYIIENEPGMDFEVTIERPESLGGGSFKTFLEWDDSIFLNIA